MNISKPFRPLVIAIILSLVLGACGALPHAARIRIIDPSDGAVLPLNQPVTIRVTAGGWSNRGPWTHDEYIISDSLLQLGHQFEPIPNTDTLTRVFVENNPAPGAHYVALAYRAARLDPDYADVPNSTYYIYDEWRTTDTVCFWVGPDAPPDFCSTVTIAQPLLSGTVTPSPLPPTFTPFPPTPVPVIDTARAHPNPVYYGDTCPTLSSVTFMAALTLPSGVTPDLVDVQAHVRAVIGSVQTDSGSMVVPLENTQSWDTATGGLLFSGTLSVARPLNDANNHFDPAALGGSSGALLWYVDASSHDPSFQNAEYLGRTLNQVIDLAPCPSSPQNPGRHPNNEGGSPNGSSGCGQYSSQLSCNLAGCSWNPQNNSCSVNP